MHDLGHSPAIPSTQLLQRDQVLAAEIQTKLQADLKRIRAVAVHIPNAAGDLGVAVGRVGDVFGGGIQGETLYILAFQRPSFELVSHAGRRDREETVAIDKEWEESGGRKCSREGGLFGIRDD